MCRNKGCSAAVDVTSLSATGGRFSHILTGDEFSENFEAQIVNGNELIGRSRGMWVKIRLRPDAEHVDIMRWFDSPGSASWGVLTRVQ